jgi:hypothetical protein
VRILDIGFGNKFSKRNDEPYLFPEFLYLTPLNLPKGRLQIRVLIKISALLPSLDGLGEVKMSR